MTAKRGCGVKEGVLFSVLQRWKQCVFGLTGRKQRGRGIQEKRSGDTSYSSDLPSCPSLPKFRSEVHAFLSCPFFCVVTNKVI